MLGGILDVERNMHILPHLPSATYMEYLEEMEKGIDRYCKLNYDNCINCTT